MIVIHWFGFSFSFLRIKVGLGRNGLSGRPPNVGVLVSKCVLSSFFFLPFFYYNFFFSFRLNGFYIRRPAVGGATRPRVTFPFFFFVFFFFFLFVRRGAIFQTFSTGPLLIFALFVFVFCFVFFFTGSLRSV